jgi:hypothetical protein
MLETHLLQSKYILHENEVTMYNMRNLVKHRQQREEDVGV